METFRVKFAKAGARLPRALARRPMKHLGAAVYCVVIGMHGALGKIRVTRHSSV